MTLYRLNLHFDLFAVNGQRQNVGVETVFFRQVHGGVVVQGNGQRGFATTINDCREFAGSAQAAARTLTLLVTYFSVDREH
ncbi:hypothetical protein ACS33_07505 [Edwardsiella ictaluri]|nr:hypothetical protein ABY58_06905 [Edwardsiella ictaluri]KOO55413.1 hypothetical protein ACS33_07505 [Edwardsiella ictaluri]